MQKITTLFLDCTSPDRLDWDWQYMLATTDVLKSDPATFNDFKPIYPYKAFGLFRLYDCFKKDVRKNKVVVVS